MYQQPSQFSPPIVGPVNGGQKAPPQLSLYGAQSPSQGQSPPPTAYRNPSGQRSPYPGYQPTKAQSPSQSQPASQGQSRAPSQGSGQGIQPVGPVNRPQPSNQYQLYGSPGGSNSAPGQSLPSIGSTLRGGSSSGSAPSSIWSGIGNSQYNSAPSGGSSGTSGTPGLGNAGQSTASITSAYGTPVLPYADPNLNQQTINRQVEAAFGNQGLTSILNGMRGANQGMAATAGDQTMLLPAMTQQGTAGAQALSNTPYQQGLGNALSLLNWQQGQGQDVLGQFANLAGLNNAQQNYGLSNYLTGLDYNYGNQANQLGLGTSVLNSLLGQGGLYSGILGNVSSLPGSLLSGVLGGLMG